MRARAVLLALVPVALLAGGCTTSSSSKGSTTDFRGEQRLVATTVEDLQSAASDGDEDKICRELLARSVVMRLARGGRTCQQTVHDALKNADSTDLSVRSVTISGARASARVKEERGKADRISTVRLVKEGGRWRIVVLR
jgi:hypothetical protein